MSNREARAHMGRALEFVDHGQIGGRNAAGLVAVHQRLALAHAVVAGALAALAGPQADGRAQQRPLALALLQFLEQIA